MDSPGSERDDAASSTRIHPASDVIARALGESAVLIRLNTNKIYELNVTGARVWDVIAGGATRAEVIAVMQQEFGGAPEDIASAVDELLDALHAEGLI
jgi:hypothetical protein